MTDRERFGRRLLVPKPAFEEMLRAKQRADRVDRSSVMWLPQSNSAIAENIIEAMPDADRRDFLLRMCGGTDEVIAYFGLENRKP